MSQVESGLLNVPYACQYQTFNTMTKPRFRVDFNERVAPDVVLLSREDQKHDASGQLVELSGGLSVEVYDEDNSTAGLPDELFAQGIVEKSSSAKGWARAAQWVCRIDANGIRHRSDVLPTAPRKPA
ncbi:hypothetical protein ACQ858_22185 [Variovorax ureilyticus]|uniref:hypothetical protein n=1 Tax=Variovorax ureilyticus TaxID=1836198 RepID=UPI003D67DAA2